MKTATMYDLEREKYKPEHIKVLLIAESPPPPPEIQSSRQFYYTDRIRKNDRLFTNTIKALYPDTKDTPERELQQNKKYFLQRLQQDGFYMIEAIETSQEHEVTKRQRQERIRESLPNLLHRVKNLATKDTQIVLVKSNVFDMAAEPLRKAGFNVRNTELVDYPGQFNQRDYREKLSGLVGQFFN